MSAARTPGPWRVIGALKPQDGEYDYAIAADIDGKPYVIAEAFGRVAETVRPNAQANASFIVLACNAHDALTAENARLKAWVGAFVAIHDRPPASVGDRVAYANLVSTARAALAGKDGAR